MPRPGDWDAIGLTEDPTPGDPETISQMAEVFQHLGGKAREIYNAIETVMNTADDSVFSGETADALRGKVDKRLRGHVEDVAWAFETSAQALRDWHGVVVEQQARADAALSAGRGLPKDDPERQRQAEIAKQAGQYQAEQGKSVSGRIRTVSHISLPISACKIFWEAFQWLAIILIIPALVLGGPIALLAIGVNLALFIKTFVDFANGDARFLDLFLAGLGLIAPTTKALPIFSILKGVGKGLVEGAKGLFQGVRQIFTRDFLFTRLLPGLSHLPIIASVAIRDTGLLVVSGIRNLPGFAGGIVRGPVQFGLNLVRGAGNLITRWSGAALQGFGRIEGLAGEGFRTATTFVGKELGGTRFLRLLLPVDAGEIRKFGFLGALRIGVIDRGLLGRHVFGAPLAGAVGHGISAVPVGQTPHTLGDGFGSLSPTVSSSPTLEFGPLGRGVDFGGLSGHGFHAARRLDGLDGLGLGDLGTVRAGDVGISITGGTTVTPSGLHVPAPAGAALNTVVPPTPGLGGVTAVGVNAVPAPGVTAVHGVPTPGATHLPGAGAIPETTNIGDLLAPAIRGNNPSLGLPPSIGSRITEGTSHGLIANQVRLGLDEVVNVTPPGDLSTGRSISTPPVDRVNSALDLVNTPTPAEHVDVRPVSASPGQAGSPSVEVRPDAINPGQAGHAGSVHGAPVPEPHGEPVLVPVRPIETPTPARNLPAPVRSDVALNGVPGRPDLSVRIEKQGSLVSHQLFNGGPTGRFDTLPGGQLRFTDTASGQTFRFDAKGNFVDKGVRLTRADGTPRPEDRIIVRDHDGAARVTGVDGIVSDDQFRIQSLDDGGFRVIHEDGASWRHGPDGHLRGEGVSFVDSRGFRGERFLEGDQLVDVQGRPLPGTAVTRAPDGGYIVHAEGNEIRYTTDGLHADDKITTLPQPALAKTTPWESDQAARINVFRRPGDSDLVVRARMTDWEKVAQAQRDSNTAVVRLDEVVERIDGPVGSSSAADRARLDVVTAEMDLNLARDVFRAEHGLDPDVVAEHLDGLLIGSVGDRPRLVGGTPTSSSRVRTQAGAMEKQYVWSEWFGESDDFRGGSRVNVELGPGTMGPGRYGSKPRMDQNRAVDGLNASKFNGSKWIRGHLWNDNLGGPGVSKNLTPMSSKANANYANKVEKLLKDAVTRMRHDGQYRKDDHWLGVELDISVIGQKFPQHPDRAVRAIADHLEIHAYWVKKPKQAALREETQFVTGDDLNGLPPLPNGTFDPVTGEFSPFVDSRPATPALSQVDSLDDVSMDSPVDDDMSTGSAASDDVSVGSDDDDLSIVSVDDDMSLGSPGAGGSTGFHWDTELADRTRIFTDLAGDDADALMIDWIRVEDAYRNYAAVARDLDVHGTRADGPSDGPSVGDELDLELHAAEQDLNAVEIAFKDKHGVSVETIRQQLHDLLGDSLTDRPRLPGGGGPIRTYALPANPDVRFEVTGTQVAIHGPGSDAFEGKVSGLTLTIKHTGSGSTWTYKRGFSGWANQVGESLPLSGGLFDGKRVVLEGALGRLEGVLEQGGSSWPMRTIEADLIIAGPHGPMRYDRSGRFVDMAPTAVGHLEAPVPPVHLTDDQLTRWTAHVDLSRAHLTAAAQDKVVENLMKDVKGGAFTSKRSFGGYVNPSALADGTLVGKVKNFDTVTKDLLFTGPADNVTVYRGVSMDPLSALADSFVERLPISTSNSFKFQEEWARNGVNSNRIVFEIDVPPTHGKLAMSYPEGYHWEGESKPWNQDQWEVTLSPTTLVRTGPDRFEGELRIIPVKAEQIPAARFDELITAKWPGMSSETAFGDFVTSFEAVNLQKFQGLEGVVTRSTTGVDGLSHTVHVSKPGFDDELTISVLRDPQADSVRVIWTADGANGFDKTWSGQQFANLATDLRGNVLHNSDQFLSMPKPAQWDHVAGKGKQFEAAWDKDFADRAAVFRAPGDTDAMVVAKLDDFVHVEKAQLKVKAGLENVALHGHRPDGPSSGSSVGARAHIDLWGAQNHLNQAKAVFEAKHRLNADDIQWRLDALLTGSMKERPRLVGGAPRTLQIPEGGATFTIEDGAVNFAGTNAGAFRGALDGTALKITEIGTDGSVVRTLSYELDPRNRPVLERDEFTLTLTGGPLEGQKLSASTTKGNTAAAIPDGFGGRVPVRYSNSTFFVPSSHGPLAYGRSGLFLGVEPTPIAKLPKVVPPADLVGDLARWTAQADLARTHLAAAEKYSSVRDMMDTIREGAFTAKRGFGGYVYPEYLKNINLRTAVRRFNETAEWMLTEGPVASTTVYRGVAMDPVSAQADKFIERLPLSTSSEWKFQPEWAEGADMSKRVVFEIDVPPSHGKLAMAYPDGYHPSAGDAPARNQEQFEVTLSPTVLERTGPSFERDGLTVIPVRAQQIPPSQVDVFIAETWELSSQEAFDDFTKAFGTANLQKFPNMSDVSATSKLSHGGLVNEITVRKPGFDRNELTITIIRDREANSVRVTAGVDGATGIDQTWSRAEFLRIATDMRSGTLHDNDLFLGLSRGTDWDAKGKEAFNPQRGQGPAEGGFKRRHSMDFDDVESQVGNLPKRPRLDGAGR